MLSVLFGFTMCVPLLHAESQTGDQKLFVGTWKLVSTEEKLRDGHTRPYSDVGAKGRGLLMYSEDGHMCVAMMDPARPQWRNDENPTDAEKISAAGFASYCGTYKVDEKKHLMVHYPDISFSPNFVGSTQERPYRFEGKRLIYSAVVPEGEVERWTIVWEKVSDFQ